MHNKKIVGMCPNFYKIVNFLVLEEDAVTKRIIKVYQSYIFRIDINNLKDVERIIKLDEVVGKYLSDYDFRSCMQNKIRDIKIKKDTKDVLKEIINGIIRIFNNYEEYTTRVICISRWI